MRDRAEGVGLDHVATHAQKIRVDVANNIWTAQHQNFLAVFFPPVIVQSGVPGLNVGPHRAVVDDDAFPYGF